jgi:hypothetical protein
MDYFSSELIYFDRAMEGRAFICIFFVHALMQHSNSHPSHKPMHAPPLHSLVPMHWRNQICLMTIITPIALTANLILSNGLETTFVIEKYIGKQMIILSTIQKNFLLQANLQATSGAQFSFSSCMSAP